MKSRKNKDRESDKKKDEEVGKEQGEEKSDGPSVKERYSSK